MSVTRPYLGITVTLTTANTAYNLLTLLKAVEPLCPAAAASFAIQIDPTSAGAKVRIGDGNVSTIRCGYVIGSGDFGGHARSWQNIPFGHISVMADTDATKINVEVMTA